MEHKTEGHLKQESVNRQLGEELRRLREDLDLTSELCQAIGLFPNLDRKDQEHILAALRGESLPGKAVDGNTAEEWRDKHEKVIGFLENRKAQVEDLKKRLNRTSSDIDRVKSGGMRAIADAKVSLWGGYSDIGLEKLTALAQGGHIHGDVRAAANYELARFYLDNDKPHSAVRCLASARALSKSFMRRLRSRVLEIEAMFAIGDTDSAALRIEDLLKFNPEETNYRIAKVNLLRQIGDQEGALAVINQTFRDHDLAPVSVGDWEQPFLTLTTPDDLPKVNGPKVSVFMSSYNAAEFIRLAVGSMQKQTWQNLEIIVVDDCSTDGSFEIIQELAREDSRIVAHQNTVNQGTYANRNLMLEMCTGDYVTVHDCDDWSHPEMIERQMNDLLNNPDVHINTTMMCRVQPDLNFNIRPSREGLEYVHMSYPAFLIKKEEAVALNGWDAIMANADAEFERRAKAKFGKSGFKIVNKEVPYSFFLAHSNSLTEQKTMNLRSLTFGSRNEYHRQSEFWVAARKAEAGDQGLEEHALLVVEPRTDRYTPFPCPNGLLSPTMKKDVLEYDLLIVSDLTLLGGTRSCNVNYIKAAHAMGKKIALFNWPRGDLRLLFDINPTYRQLAQDGLVEIVTWEDTVKAKTLMIHHPPILDNLLDKYPAIETDKIIVLVNQLPFQTTEREKVFYKPGAASREISKIFDCDDIEWISISELSMEYLQEYSGEIRIREDIWYPPIVLDPDRFTISPEERHDRLAATGGAFGRHTRDHWTKWPGSMTKLRQLYMLDDNINFSILGGANTAGRILKGVPDSWTVHEYDAISVADLLSSIDIYLNFNNSVYIEEFGRNVMEAMSLGIPVIADTVFTRTFGDAILGTDDNPRDIVEKLRNDRSMYLDYAQRGIDYVEKKCAYDAVYARLQSVL